jgi:hypothetical protein
MSPVRAWATAHDFVSQYVPPALGTNWPTLVRAFVADTMPVIPGESVLDDEFPLSIFYASLRAQLPPLDHGVPSV